MPSKTALLLHIGSQKTGTTSIQRVLSANAERLEREGVLYPSSGRPTEDAIKHGHHALAWNAIDLSHGRTSDTTAIQSVLWEIEEKSLPRAVISSEDFWNPHAVDPIADALRELTTDIVVSLRRQDEYLNAMYYTSICHAKHGLSPDEYAETTIRTRLDYLSIIERYRKAFPEATLTIRLYERGLSPRTDAVGDFMKVANLSHLINKEEGALHSHKTLSAQATAALRILSKTGLTPLEFYNIFDAAHISTDKKNDEIFSYSPEFRKRLMQQYHDSNAELRRKYYDGRNESLFKDAVFEPEHEWRRKVAFGDEAVARLMLDISNAFRSLYYSPPRQ